MSTFPDLYATVTARVVAALEAGTPPWIRPWTGTDADPMPANATSHRPYRGINVLLLNLQAMSCGYGRNRWLTFQQALSIGARVRTGEHGTPIVFFKMHELDANVKGKPEAGDATRRVVPLLRSFTVFNVDQVDDLPSALVTPVLDTIWDPIEEAERLIGESGAVLRHGGSRAFYAPSLDAIQLPPRGAFASPTDYYATALHELTHWTGHPQRCNRPLEGRHAISAYAFEELIAEMGSAFLCSHCRLPGRLQHASYIASWLQALRNDKRLIFTAASLAQKAADYLLPQPSQAEAVAPLAQAA